MGKKTEKEKDRNAQCQCPKERTSKDRNAKARHAECQSTEYRERMQTQRKEQSLEHFLLATLEELIAVINELPDDIILEVYFVN